MSQIKNKLSHIFSGNKKKNDETVHEMDNEINNKQEDPHDDAVEEPIEISGQMDHVKDFENDYDLQKDMDTDVDWETRILCSDGNCIGVIGPDGRCKECGKVYEGDELVYPDDQQNFPNDQVSRDDESLSDEQNASSVDTLEHNSTTQEPTDEAEADLDSETGADLEWENRTLCSDGNCIGVIGPDGRCKECGKPYEE